MTTDLTGNSQPLSPPARLAELTANQTADIAESSIRRHPGQPYASSQKPRQ